MKSVFVAVITIVLTQFLFIDVARTQTPDNGMVEVNYPLDVEASYKERRQTHGANVGLNTTFFRPYNWESLLDDVYFDDTYGQTPVQILSLEVGYKFNFVLGSLSLLLGGGMGEGDAAWFGVGRTMRVTKGLSKAMFILDNLLPEPKVAPYVSGSAWIMRISELQDGDDDVYNWDTGVGLEYSVGTLIQLNWLEPDLSRESLASLGLQNTYLDVFASQHFRTAKTSDPSTSTDLNFGAGIRLEF